MNSARVFYHCVRADFLERVRRGSFLVTLVFAAYFGYLAVSGELKLTVGQYRGVYNSAWIGALMSLVTTTLLTLAGFYIVKNSIERDERTRVGQIIATTPVSKAFYTCAKAMSNFAVLAAMVGVLAVAAIVMQWLRAEDPRVHLMALLTPFLLIALPAMAFTAAVAVLFESVRWLRGGIGNVVYFFLWTFLLAGSVQTGRFGDMTGINVYMRTMGAIVRGIDPTYKGGFALQISNAQQAPLKTFVWTGIPWSFGLVGERLLWFAVALGLAVLAAEFFHRFDPARSQKIVATAAGPASASVEDAPSTAAVDVRLTPVETRRTFPLGHIFAAELKLMLKGRSRWWYVVGFGLWCGAAFSPLATSRGVLVFAWLWPILLWSQMGVRESACATESLVFSCSHSLRRQFLASWLAGIALTALTGSGALLRVLVAGDHAAALAWFAGAVFIPSLALACGAWSGTPRLFEALYMVWWYIGPAEHVPGVDFIGAAAALPARISADYFVLAAVLLFGAFLGRWRRVSDFRLTGLLGRSHDLLA